MKTIGAILAVTGLLMFFAGLGVKALTDEDESDLAAAVGDALFLGSWLPIGVAVLIQST